MELCTEWAKHFQNLYTTSRKTGYDDQFKLKIEEELVAKYEESLSKLSSLSPFKVDDVIAICKDLKCKKAPGYDCIVAEHYKYAGPECIKVITHIFNGICESEHIPYQFKRGVVVPIPKGDKDKSSQDNHRGITLLQTMRKIFEKGLLKKKIKKWVKENKIINDLQGAEQEKCSSIETNWIVRETVCHYLEQGSSLYICMMDVKKAFDSVWQKALFHKLYMKGLDPKVWRLVMKLYQEPECCVQIAGITSHWIKAWQGIIQGAPLSMFHYEVMTDDLLEDLVDCEAGTVIGDITTTSPTFADDLIVMAPNRSGLQKLINKAYDHSQRWRYEFNPDKCMIVAFGKEGSEESSFYMGHSVIKVIAGHEHVGTLLTESKRKIVQYIQKRIERCEKPGYAITGIGSKMAPMTPKSSSTLYWSVCMPKLTYGFQVMDIPEEAVRSAESFHAKMAKVFQGLPDQACNVGAVASMGWMSIQGYVDMMALLFFMKIINLSATCIYKRLFIVRYCYHIFHENGTHCGPVRVFIDLCKKYDLFDVLRSAVEDCVIPSKSEWKAMVKNKIWDLENRQWSVNSRFYSTLNILRNGLCSVRLLSWWEYIQVNPADMQKCRTVARLLFDCHRLKACLYRYKESNVTDPYCEFCDNRAIENAEHILFRCPENSRLRRELWSRIRDVSPPALYEDVEEMSINSKCMFILGGFATTYVHDWYELYSACADFIHKIYYARIGNQGMD